MPIFLHSFVVISESSFCLCIHVEEIIVSIMIDIVAHGSHDHGCPFEVGELNEIEVLGGEGRG